MPEQKLYVTFEDVHHGHEKSLRVAGYQVVMDKPAIDDLVTRSSVGKQNITFRGCRVSSCTGDVRSPPRCYIDTVHLRGVCVGVSHYCTLLELITYQNAPLSATLAWRANRRPR